MGKPFLFLYAPALTRVASLLSTLALGKDEGILSAHVPSHRVTKGGIA